MQATALSGGTREPVSIEFESMFREHYQMVYRTAYSILGSSADAEDVLQTIFLRLLRRELSSALLSNAKGYFYRAAVNLSLDILRAKKRIELVGDSERFESIADISDTKQTEARHRRVTEAIAELNPNAAHILILRYVHDYSDAEIAKLLGTSRTAIAVRLFRSRARLKRLLRDLEDDR
jgi:RNA polymerase sigma-70 factor (ECF subfamily)